jgi:hypothetical protein
MAKDVVAELLNMPDGEEEADTICWSLENKNERNSYQECKKLQKVEAQIMQYDGGLEITWIWDTANQAWRKPPLKVRGHYTIAVI